VLVQCERGLRHGPGITPSGRCDPGGHGADVTVEDLAMSRLRLSLGVVVLAAAWSMAGCEAPAAPDGDPVALAAARFADARVPVEERRAGLDRLGRAGDERSARVLMQVAAQRTYLNWAAVAALGRCRGPEVEAFLAGKLEDADARVVTHAIESYTAVAGGRAAPALVAVLENNRARADGFEQGVQTAAVKALGGLRATAAVPVLGNELARVAETGRHLEYGSALVEALAKIADRRARPAVEGYAVRLAARLPGDASARQYVEGKIAEARRALENL
jgi:hypothetical protein